MQWITKVHLCLFYFLRHHLVFCFFFTEELFSLGPEQLGCLQDKEKPGAKVSAVLKVIARNVPYIFLTCKVYASSLQVRVIPLELQRLFVSLLLVDQQSASTANLTDSFGWNSSEVCAQYLCQ